MLQVASHVRKEEIMTRDDIRFIADFLKKESGISLDEGKSYLINSRLFPAMRDLGVGSTAEMISRIRNGDRIVSRYLIEIMTTNETFFFRDERVFEFFEKEIVRKLDGRFWDKGKLRIWSAACSYGQEAYSIAMILSQNRTYLGNRKVEILGSDISEEALTRARSGIYSDFEMKRGLPPHYRDRYFNKASNGASWRISDDIRQMVRFRHFNLMDDFCQLGTFEIVFMRNVLLYFDNETRTSVLKKLHRQIAPQGILVLGGVETVSGLRTLYRQIPGQRGFFEKVTT